MQDRLVFLISAPRSGSTLLQRILGRHSSIFSLPEPHIITPLAYLGYHHRVDQAPYDHINAAEAIRLFVEQLPQGEQDYLDALRAYTDTLYRRVLAPSGKQYFLDKTPAYALVGKFLRKLYPDAHYLVLTRHPLGVMSSYANSFFGGDWEQALEYNPVVERYTPALADFLRDSSIKKLPVSYENLVIQPELELAKICDFLDVSAEPATVEYGATSQQTRTAGSPIRSPGDPVGVHRHHRPVRDSAEKWIDELKTSVAKRKLSKKLIDRLKEDDLTMVGTSKKDLLQTLSMLEAQAGDCLPVNAWDSSLHRSRKRLQSLKQSVVELSQLRTYRLEREALLALRKDIHHRPHGALVRRVRYYCDVLLRDTL